MSDKYELPYSITLLNDGGARFTGKFPVLSIREPWATLIKKKEKTMELRTYRLPKVMDGINWTIVQVPQTVDPSNLVASKYHKFLPEIPMKPGYAHLLVKFAQHWAIPDQTEFERVWASSHCMDTGTGLPDNIAPRILWGWEIWDVKEIEPIKMKGAQRIRYWEGTVTVKNWQEVDE